MKKSVAILLTAVLSGFAGQSFGQTADVNFNKLKQTAESEDVRAARAAFHVGLLYKTGHRVKKDEKKAFKLFRIAAEKGHVSAQSQLGFCYFFGRGVEKDWKEAIKWLRMSAENGDRNAQRFLAWCYQRGCGVEKDLNEAAKWIRLASEPRRTRRTIVRQHPQSPQQGPQPTVAVQSGTPQSQTGKAPAESLAGSCGAK